MMFCNKSLRHFTLDINHPVNHSDGSIDGWTKSLCPESATKIAAKTPRCWLIYILEVPGWAPQSSLLFSTSSHAL